MGREGGLTCTEWQCLSHVVFIPKPRKKALCGRLRRSIGRILRDLCEQRVRPRPHVVEHSAEVELGSCGGVLDGQSAVRVYRELLKERRTSGLYFWATGCCVSTVGLNE